MTDTLEIDGYTVNIAADEYPDNPFKAWDCEPPLLAHHDKPKAYNDAPETVGDVLALLPPEAWERRNRAKLIAHLPGSLTIRDWAEERRNRCDSKDAYQELVDCELGTSPDGWGAACDWMDWAEGILTAFDIPALSTETYGYCQGDVARLLLVATPEWLSLTGVAKEDAPAQLEGAAKLYGHWAWGDVYGVSNIEDPEGNEIEDGSCWGFYGSDHEESGLLDHARACIEWHKEPACLI
jgi:hypothetical protein